MTPSTTDGSTKQPMTKANEFQTETYTIISIIEEILAPNGYHDKKGIGIVATRPPWLLKDDIREIQTAVRNERILYKNKILKWVVDRQQKTETSLQVNHNTLLNEQEKFFLLRDRKLILDLERAIAADRATLDILQKIQSLLTM
jgi:hypothetical protein